MTCCDLAPVPPISILVGTETDGRVEEDPEAVLTVLDNRDHEPDRVVSEKVRLTPISRS